MASLELLGTRCINGDGLIPPAPDNDNRHLLPDWMTPAELMQWARQEKQRLAKELAADISLWNCPEHRRTWDMTIAIEKCALRQCYGAL